MHENPYVCEKVLLVAPDRFNTFPTLKQIEDLIREFKTPTMPAQRFDRSQWYSTRARGTPAHMEAIFIMIENNKTETGAFRMKFKSVGMSEELLWECYEAWFKGQVHEETRKAALRKTAALGLVMKSDLF